MIRGPREDGFQAQAGAFVVNIPHDGRRLIGNRLPIAKLLSLLTILIPL